MKRVFQVIFLVLSLYQLRAQGEYNNWYFGNKAGMDFNSNPPAVLTNGKLISYEPCSAVSDAAGNLLFYTDGITVWDRNHMVMLNGTSLMGGQSAAQSGMIVKKPGSTTLFYIFTVDDWNGFYGLRYSIVDLSLNGGNRDVTVKNLPLLVSASEKLTATRHCNGNDIWIVAHDKTTKFVSFLLTSSGISTNSVVSTIGASYSQSYGGVGCMKTSPNGKKLAVGIYSPSSFELYDFDNTTGSVFNLLTLGGSYSFAYGCEFSPDGSKLYGTEVDSGNRIMQWDLCAGSNSAIVASVYTTTFTAPGQIQRAPDGKLYVGAHLQNQLSVINNPNATGPAAGFQNLSFTLTPGVSQSGLPNMPLTKVKPSPFTYSFNCNNYSFFLPPSITTSASGCTTAGFSLTSSAWNFGDPSSGAANTSSSIKPTHAYMNPGTYTVQLIQYYSCGGGTDTLYTTVNVLSVPAVTVVGKQNICLGETTTLTATGASSYSWNTQANTSTIAINPMSTTVYTLTGIHSSTCQSTSLVTVSVSLCTSLPASDVEGPLLVFPNPTNGLLSVHSTNKTTLYLYSTLGELLLKKEILSGDNEIDLSGMREGIYILKRPKEGTGIKVFKINH